MTSILAKSSFNLLIFKCILELSQLGYNACITRLLPCRLSPNLPLNTVNSKKPRMPNVANRVDAFVRFSLPKRGM